MIEKTTPENKIDSTIENEVDLLIKNLLDTYPKINELPPEFESEINNVKKDIDLLIKGQLVRDGVPTLKYNKYNNQLDGVINGEKVRVTLGEIVSGEEWGNNFNLEYASFQAQHKSKKMYESYVLYFAKRSITAVLDKYILEKEIEHNRQFQNIQMQNAYEGIKGKNETNPREFKRSGYIAEKIIQSFLIRMSVDKPNLGFEIIQTNAYQDVVGKIDFIVKIKNNEKGVKTFITKEIQFTITSDAHKLELKEEQLRRLQGRVLIHMPELKTHDMYENWLKNKEAIAGPDIGIDTETEKQILTEILK